MSRCEARLIAEYLSTSWLRREIHAAEEANILAGIAGMIAETSRESPRRERSRWKRVADEMKHVHLAER